MNASMRPILILGIEMRSGTNYIFDLISKHPDCEPASEILEDQILLELGYIEKYLSALQYFWKKFTPIRTTKESMYAHAEKFLHALLKEQCLHEDREVFVTKSPSFVGMGNLAKMLPNTRVILFVRDGRSVAYSLEKSFGTEYFKALRRWQRGAQLLDAFKKDNPEYYQKNCLVVRYEDIFTKTEENLRSVFCFMGVDPERYDYASAQKSPVIGSSDLRDSQARIHWEKKERQEDFDPLKRYDKWAKWKRDYSTVYLARELSELGYEVDRKPGPDFWFIHGAHLARIASEKLSLRSVKDWAKNKMLAPDERAAPAGEAVSTA